jgi:hypothetical protein
MKRQGKISCRSFSENTFSLGQGKYDRYEIFIGVFCMGQSSMPASCETVMNTLKPIMGNEEAVCQPTSCIALEIGLMLDIAILACLL